MDPPPPSQHRPGHRPPLRCPGCRRPRRCPGHPGAGGHPWRRLRAAGPHRRGGWYYYWAPSGLGNVCPDGLEHVDWRGRGGYVVAPPSRHASGHPYRWAPDRDLDSPPAEVPAVLLERLQPRQIQRGTGPVQLAVADRPGDRLCAGGPGRGAGPVAAAPVGQRNRQLWESTRNLYNLVATGALDHREVDQGLLDAAERCGLLAEEPARPAAPRPRAARSAWPTPAAHSNPPPPNTPTARRSRLLEQSASDPGRGGDGHGWRRPPGRLKRVQEGGRAAAKQSPRPPHHPQKEFLDGQPPHPSPPPAGRRGPRAPPRRLDPQPPPARPSGPASRPSTGSIPPSASPPTAPTPSATATSPNARPPWPSASRWPSTTAARTTATRSSGRPARTTAWPRPSRPPAPSPPALVGGRNASAPNANHRPDSSKEPL